MYPCRNAHPASLNASLRSLPSAVSRCPLYKAIMTMKYYHNARRERILLCTKGYELSNLNFGFFSEECSSKGGSNEGSCASGFGVCCIGMYPLQNKYTKSEVEVIRIWLILWCSNTARNSHHDVGGSADDDIHWHARTHACIHLYQYHLCMKM